MPKEPKKLCPHCGASMVEYRHTFNEALAEGLFRLYQAGTPVNLKTLELDRNQWDNFQKLRYWDLVEKFINDEGNRVGGTWLVTPHGKDFVEGHTTIQRNVFTYRGERVRYEGKTVFFKNNHPGQYKTRLEYADEAVPHDGSFVSPTQIDTEVEAEITVPAIETIYNGYRFRSRLEARWAVFLDTAKLDWEYEIEGYKLSNGIWYLPDFWLPTFLGGVYIEVKPSTRSDVSKPRQFVLDSGKPMILGVGTPASKRYVLLTKRDGVVVEEELRFGPEFRQAINAARAIRFDKADAAGV